MVRIRVKRDDEYIVFLENEIKDFLMELEELVYTVEETKIQI